MNNFVKQTLLFCIPVIFFLGIVELLLRNIPNDYSYKKKYLDTHSNEIETLFLGSSHAFYAINPAFVHSKSFNAAKESQSLDYDNELLKKYASQSGKLKFIFIPIDYFSLYNLLETGVESWRIKNYTIYYGFNGNYSLKGNSEILNGKLQENMIRIIKFYRYHKSNITCNTLGWGKENNSKNAKDLITTGKVAAERHAKKSNDFHNKIIKIINEIIVLAKSKKAKVIFYTSPAYKTYVSQLNAEQLQKTYTTIISFANSNDNVFYCGFLMV
jgi:hypothetical protein